MRYPRRKVNSGRQGEVWIGLIGLSYPMRAENIKKQGKDLVFTRLVEVKDGSRRKEMITTKQENVLYVSETIEAAS